MLTYFFSSCFKCGEAPSALEEEKRLLETRRQEIFFRGYFRRVLMSRYLDLNSPETTIYHSERDGKPITRDEKIREIDLKIEAINRQIKNKA